MDGIAFVADIRIPARRRSQRDSRDFYHWLQGIRPLGVVPVPVPLLVVAARCEPFEAATASG